MSINTAFIGFEFEHHVQAVLGAIEKLKKSSRTINPLLWSARDSLENSVAQAFPNRAKVPDAGAPTTIIAAKNSLKYRRYRSPMVSRT